MNEYRPSPFNRSGSVAGALPAAKSLLYRWFRSKEVAEKPDDPRITAFSQLIANDGACATAAIVLAVVPSSMPAR